MKHQTDVCRNIAPALRTENQTDPCTATGPSPTCNKKPEECPAEGYYWAVFHVCHCCGGPEIVKVQHGHVESFDGGIVPWEYFNGHLVSGAIVGPATRVVIANPERVERARHEWHEAVHLDM